jgi:hypothetical protein
MRKLWLITTCLCTLTTGTLHADGTYSAKSLVDDYLKTHPNEVSSPGNRKPYLVQLDVCEGMVKTFVGNGELVPKGVKMIMVAAKDCNFFVAEYNSDDGRMIRKICPIGSLCRIAASVIGDGPDFIAYVERVDTPSRQ